VRTSVLLAAYQGGKYLPAQLASLSAQRDADFEVLYQDDGSADGTPEILRAWAEKDARFHPAARQGEHLGPAGNFFSLLCQAQGDYLLLCDQDDVWEPEKISVLLQAARSVPDPSLPLLVHSDASLIDGSGNPLAPSFFRLQGWDPQAVHLNQLLVQNNATGCLMLLNRPLASLVTRHGDPSRMFMHDWFIALTAAAFGQILFVDQPLVRYRQHGENVLGASRDSLVRRAAKALQDSEKARARIALTYTHTQAFQDAFGESLPPEAAGTLRQYLETRSLPKLRRLQALRTGGFLMQSPVTRLGQYLFG